MAALAPSASTQPTPGTTPELVVETRGLTKRYGSVAALDQLDVAIPRAAVGLLGANGAGKTTLLKTLLGLTTPTAGSATVLGYDTRSQGVALRARVGYMPEGDCLPPGATAADFVSHMAEMSGLPTRAARQRAADVLYQVGLDEERYRLIKGFSTGMKQRVKLAQAIVHDPGLVMLDEPTAGMDPQGRDDMLALIQRIQRMLGIAVIVSSHILEDIERVCDYVVIMNEGRLVAAQSLTGVGTARGGLVVRIEGDAQGLVQRLTGLGVATRWADPDGPQLFPEIVIPQADDRALDLVRDTAADLGIVLRGLHPEVRSLEDLYLGSVVGEEVADGR